MIELLETRGIYLMVTLLLGIGFYGMFARPNLIHKVIGLTVFQAAIFLFFIGSSLRTGATVPIIDPALGSDPDAYVDPLPHLLILTAIVVGAATLGVALALVIRLYRAHGTLEDGELVAALDATAGRPIERDGDPSGSTPPPDDDHEPPR